MGYVSKLVKVTALLQFAPYFPPVRAGGLWYRPLMSQPIKITSKIRLRDFKPNYHEGMDKDKAREKTDKYCERIDEYQHLLYANRTHSLLLVFQGMDTSGKDGAGKSVLRHVIPAGVETTNFK